MIRQIPADRQSLQQVGEVELVDGSDKPGIHVVDECVLALVGEIHASAGHDRIDEAEQRSVAIAIPQVGGVGLEHPPQ